MDTDGRVVLDRGRIAQRYLHRWRAPPSRPAHTPTHTPGHLPSPSHLPVPPFRPTPQVHSIDDTPPFYLSQHHRFVVDVFSVIPIEFLVPGDVRFIALLKLVRLARLRKMARGAHEDKSYVTVKMMWLLLVRQILPQTRCGVHCTCTSCCCDAEDFGVIGSADVPLPPRPHRCSCSWPTGAPAASGCSASGWKAPPGSTQRRAHSRCFPQARPPARLPAFLRALSRNSLRAGGRGLLTRRFLTMPCTTNL